MAQLEKLEDDAAQNNSRMEELGAERQERVKELDALIDGVKAVNDEEGEAKNQGIELKHELEKINAELKEAQQKIKSCKKQVTHTLARPSPYQKILLMVIIILSLFE